ncbi:polysaccharide pyruvyl transferase family protein [Streptococcus suis]|uniref:polysaccharide pyruvyl transferase family protein n=1 Tax=Streptococcus suis TaxID=1307 RepID=UPI000C195610|nr:polysaccharide pyruvyl transferase family protein [Streptococcus suis]
MEKITVLDTSVATANLGDQIIVDAVRKELKELFPQDMFFQVPTHTPVGRYGRRLIKESKHSFVAGTNLLTSHFHLIRSKSWDLYPLDIFQLKDITLLGTGWSTYQKDVSVLQKYAYKRILSTSKLHSVRDSYTLKKLQAAGITNVINTGCATMWRLTPEHCSEIPARKAKNVVFTLTDYSKDIIKDQKMIDILKSEYETVYFWPQGSGDMCYFNQLNSDGIKILPPILEDYDALLKSDLDVEFVGTRLHGGIRAMQFKRKATIIGIDNRAEEKKKDFNIRVVSRNTIESLPNWLNDNEKTQLTINFDAINKWKAQFYLGK